MSIPREFGRLRTVITRSFNTQASVLRKTSVSDTSGGFTDSYASVATYPCSFSRFPIRPREIEAAERIQALTYWQFVFSYTADVRSTDRLLCDGRTFEVAGTGHSAYNIDLIVTALEIL